MARQFNPNEHADDTDDGEKLTIAGEFLLAARTLKRDKNRNKKPYFLVKIEVVAGALRGKWFHERVYINDEALWKVGKWCKAMDQKEKFDLDCNRSSYDALCNMPFKAKTSTRKDGEKTYCDIDQFYTTLTEKEVAFINKWRASWEAHADTEGDKKRPNPGAGEGDRRRGGDSSDPMGEGYGGDPGPSGGGYGGDEFSDDDIPF